MEGPVEVLLVYRYVNDSKVKSNERCLCHRRREKQNRAHFRRGFWFLDQSCEALLQGARSSYFCARFWPI
jgi:hypothetical protein